MATRPSSKRSKGALALSLLHRDKSRTEDKDEDGNLSDNASPTASATSSPTSALSSRNPLTHIRSRHKGAPEAATAASPLENALGPTESTKSLETATKVSPSGLPDDSAMSIEQSVRTFRLFEVLRSGDKTFISKAIKESWDSSEESTTLPGTTILHLAIQCAEPQVVEYVISTSTNININARDREGNTPIHLAAQLGRAPIVRYLLDQPGINDSITNYHGRTPLDLARTPEIFQQLQLSRSLFVDTKTREVTALVAQGDYDRLEKLLVEPRVETVLDVNGLELATDPVTVQTGGTLLHEAARKRDTKLIQLLLMHGADPFRRDRKGKLPQDVTKDDRTRGILKKSPAAVMAQRGIQEKAILGNTSSQRPPGQSAAGDGTVAGKDGREMKGYLKKWTNYTSGYKLRWFVLEDGVLSYYKHQDDAGSACRGAINMRIAKLHMDVQDKTHFEIHGKSSVKYHLKANHVVEAKRWFWALNNAIQWTKDEAKEEDKRRTRDAEMLRQARVDQVEKNQGADTPADSVSIMSGKANGKSLAPGSSLDIPSSKSKVSFQSSLRGSETAWGDEDGSAYDSYEPSLAPISKVVSNTVGTATVEGEGDGEEYGDDGSSHEVQPANKDAFNITAQSAKLQLDLLAHVSSALQTRKSKDPNMVVSDPTIDQALSAYQAAVGSLNALVVDLLKISRDRDAYWQYRLDREADARKMWEDSMARVAKEHEELQSRIGESEDKRKRTKRALKEALEGTSAASSRHGSRGASQDHIAISEALEKVQLSRDGRSSLRRKSIGNKDMGRRMSVIAQFTNISDSESGDDEEFFDAVDAGEVEVVTATSPPPTAVQADSTGEDMREGKKAEILPSFRGYEDPIRKKLKMDADNRPKISLWGILKSMIGKDMTKMTLPVSFNEPTSLLQRVAEDMEYADLLDIAADRTDSSERMLYVAAFAASEYASTIGRVAKPFNPLLGETYEYVRPDKGYRFFIEQVSHHPPIGAAWAEAPKWDYYGESAVKSKFYGRSFDINPLGTWFLKLRPATGGEELYTWKKVTSSVVGIITGSPTVDNYGPMEVKNWTTGESCHLEFKQRGWKASSAYHVSGKVVDKEGLTRWSIGGRWNDKIYARLTPGFEGSVTPPHGTAKTHEPGSTQAFLVWESHPRPNGIPFNLTPFVVTLNAVPDNLKRHLPATDTRLRPDQRAMEDGEYDFAATEKNRVEEKQRAKRRERENKGEEFAPKWFEKAKCKVTGEQYWMTNKEYWRAREKGDWSACEDIF